MDADRVLQSSHSPIKRSCSLSAHRHPYSINWGLLLQTNWFGHDLTFKIIKSMRGSARRKFHSEHMYLNFQGMYVEALWKAEGTSNGVGNTPKVWEEWERLVSEGNVG